MTIDADVRTKATQVLNVYTTMTPAVMAALPECGSPPLSAVEISKVVKVGSRSTVRIILCNMVKVGIATAKTVPVKHGIEHRVYTRAPGIVPARQVDIDAS